ncbi:hypothetical protein PLESTF_000829800 [Pleodorina starrii]|nr:hypothetical protein PLESTF_000829800 [Pleodorina starrii]
MGARLAPNQNYCHEQLEVFGAAASLGLNALDCLRPVLKASQHELDAQRYNLARKMTAYGLYEHGMSQGKILLVSVATSPGTVAGPADLHIAAIANVLVCYAELVKQGASRAEALWREIYGPVDSLLALARDAAEPQQAAKRLEPVLNCLSKVIETLQYASVVCKLSCEAVAEQLSALTLCGTVCQREQEVTGLLAEDAAAAPDTVKLALVDTLVYIIATNGSLSESLQPMFHDLIINLVQKRVGQSSVQDDRHLGLARHDTLTRVQALTSGTSALTIAMRVQVAHALCTGQLSSFHQDMPRYMELLKQLLHSAKQRQRSGESRGVGPATLQNISASLGNAGLDLLQAQHTAPAAVLLQAAADIGFERVRQIYGQGNPLPEADVSQLVKKCKAHVTALQQLATHEAAMAAAANYVAKMHAVADGKAHLMWSLTKHFVQSSLAAYDAAMLAAAAAAPQPSAAPVAAASVAPAAPCKAQRRGGRLQRMQADAQPQASRPSEPATDAAACKPAVSKAASVVPRTLIQLLAAAAVEKGGHSELLDALDLYAVQELEVVREESKRREEDSLQLLYAAAVLGALSKCVRFAGSTQALCARELLVKAIASGATLEAQASDLRASCELLDAQLSGCQEERALPTTELGLLDSAALSHAQLGLCLAQLQLTGHGSEAAVGASSHIGQAIALWRRLLAGHAGDEATLMLRMPQATLHAALQVQQYVHLHPDAHPEAVSYSGDVVWRLMRVLGHQVKLREQHVYLLSATMPLTTCMAWVVGVQPTAPLGEACADATEHRKLAEVLKVTEPIRGVYATDATDHVEVASIADACGAEMERSGFLRHGPGPQRLRCQCHQIAAAAYLRAGKTSSAYVQAYEALRITYGLFERLDCPRPWDEGGAAGTSKSSASAETGSSSMTPAQAAAAAVKSGAAASALDYTSDAVVAHDDLPSGAEQQQQPGKGGPSSGQADKGTSQEAQSGRGLSVGLAWAVAAAHMASLHNAARVFEAAGCVEDAMFFWKECSRTAEMFGAAGVRALCCNYQAELSCRRGDAEAAATQLEAAAVVASTSGTCDTIEAALLTAHSCSARARLALLRERHGEVDAASQSGIAAFEAAISAVHQQKQAAACGTGCTDVRKRHDALAWHGVCLRAQLERLRAEALLQLGRHHEARQRLQAALGQLEQAALACSKRSAAEVWPVDYGLVLAHRASSIAPTSYGTSSIVGLGGLQPASCGSKDGSAQAADSVMSDTADESTSTDQSSKRGVKAKVGCGLSRSSAKQDQQEPARHANAASWASAPAVDVPALLRSLQLCWQLPLAAVYACRQLLNASIALGLPYAATMFLHLGHCMSYAQQQALQRESERYVSRGAGQPSGAIASHTRTEDASASSGKADDAGMGRKAGEEIAFTTDVREAVLSMLSSLDLDGAGSSGSFTALESGAEAWLRGTLSVLPAGAVVSAIVQDSQAHQLLVGRASRDSAPLLVVLPSSGADTAGQQPPERAVTSSSSPSHVLDQCVARLRRLLDESGDSMQVDQDAPSVQSHKVKWWKTRVALDNSVKGLLQELDEQCLGPWRCLLLSSPSAHLGVWRAAAEGFIVEHFSSLLGERDGSSDAAGGGRVAVLRDLLSVALSGMRHLQGGDLAVLLGVVCGQLGISGGASSASSLAVELAAAEAAARVQLLKLPPAELATGPGAVSVGGARCTDASPGSEASGRGTGPAAARTTVGRTAVVPPSRARPGTACGPLQGAAAGPRSGLRDTTRRLGAASSSVAAESADAENAPQQSAAALDTTGRARRTTRATATQPEPPSLAAASKSAARGASTRLATRSRTGAAVLEDSASGTNKLDTGRVTAGASAQPEPTASMGADSKPEACGAAPQQSAGPVLLVLSHALHGLPWESIPCCHGKEIYRILSLPVACAAAVQRPGMGHASGASDFGGAAGPAKSGGKRESSSTGNMKPGVSAFYVLNPCGDLVETQSFFRPILEAQPLWEGITGERPSSQALLAALQSRDLFLYFGHGSGEQFLPLPLLRKLQRCATCLLMGCSSGSLRLHGAYDPSGAAVAYILAGCPALVANLWDVTDRDIDRYCQALMHAWLGCAGCQPMTASSTCRTNAAKSELHCPDVQAGSQPLGLAVTSSRGACKLAYLIGAAPVCYGLPPTFGNGP